MSQDYERPKEVQAEGNASEFEASTEQQETKRASTHVCL